MLSGRVAAVVMVARLRRLPQRLDELDQRPRVVLGQLALERRHRRRMTVHDLVVQDAFRIEFVTELVGKIRGWLVLGRIRTVALPKRTVAFLTIRGEERFAFFDEVGRGLQRALFVLPAFWNGPPRVLRGSGECEHEHEGDCEGQFPHPGIIVPSMQPEQQRISRSRRWFLRAAALFGGGFTALKSTSSSAADLPNQLGGPVSAYGNRSRFEKTLRMVGTPRTPQAAASLTPLGESQGIITASALHYERHHSGVPELDPSTHTLTVHGLVNRQ